MSERITFVDERASCDVADIRPPKITANGSRKQRKVES